MTHCPYYECLMNGSNLVTEADKKPFALCPICLRKLDTYCEIGPTGIQDRYTQLIAVIEEQNNQSFYRELVMYKELYNTVENIMGVQPLKKQLSSSFE